MAVTIDGTSGINTPGVVNTAAETIATTLAVTGAATLSSTLAVTGVTTFAAGTAALPAITTTGDTNTGIFFPVADTIGFSEGGAEIARFDSSGNFGLGVTPSAWSTASSTRAMQFPGGGTVWGQNFASNNPSIQVACNAYLDSVGYKYFQSTFASQYQQNAGAHQWQTAPSGTAGNAITFTQAMTLDSSGNFMVGKTDNGFATNGSDIQANGEIRAIRSANPALLVHRLTNDGTLVQFAQDSTIEGTISVSGTTVSYNGGHLSRWAQTTTAKDDSLVKGTVLSNLDEMNVYTDADGQPVDNEQLNKVKVSDVEGDANVAGVFVNWDYDEAHDVDEINMAMTGDMIIRIAQGVTVARGDLLMSAGDGTAKPQGDDIVRSKTVAKVTSTHVTCTYADGSFCVPCVLMAC